MIRMSLNFLAKLLLTKQLKIGEGEIKLKYINLIMIPSIFLYKLTKYYIENNKLNLLYLLGWICGFFVMNDLIKIFKPKSVEQIYRLGMDFAESVGIGIYKTHNYYPGRYTYFIIYNNPFAKWFEKFQEPVDYFISGIMAGGGCFVHKSICQNIELKCIAKGDKFCEFLTGTENELKNRNLWEIVEKRYNLQQIYPIQKFVYNNINKMEEKILLNNVIKKLSEVEKNEN